MTALSVFGRMCMAMSRTLLAPTQRAASTNSFSLSDRNAGAHQTGQRHPVEHANDADDEQENADLGSKDARSGSRNR